MDIGQAMQKAEEGFLIFRPCWSDLNFVVYRKGYPDGVPCDLETARAWRLTPRDTFKCMPYYQCENNDGMHYIWRPTSDDAGADDWDYCSQREDVYHH